MAVELFAGVPVDDGDGWRKAVYRDPDGNEFGLGGGPG
jgi:hypothetical protein